MRKIRFDHIIHLKNYVILLFLCANWLPSQAQGITHTWHTPFIQSFQIAADLVVDTSGNVWTSGGGEILWYDGTNWNSIPVPDPDSSYGELAVESVNQLWVGTLESGLYFFDGNSWTQYTQSNSNLPDNKIQDLFLDQAGELWIGTREGLVQWNNGNLVVFNTSNSNLPDNDVNVVTADGSGNLYLGALDFFVKFNGTSFFEEQTMNAITGRFASWIQDIAVGPNGDIVVATRRGLVLNESNTWSLIDIPENQVNLQNMLSATIDQDGVLYFGELSEGLYRLEGDELYLFTSSDTDFVPGSQVYKLLTLPDNTKWMSGIAGGVVSFRDDAFPLILPSFELEVTTPTCFGAADGTIHIQSSGGVPPYSYSIEPVVPLMDTSVMGVNAGEYTITLEDSIGLLFSETVEVTQPDSLFLSFSTQSANGGNPDGSATVMVSGGTAPYDVVWSTDPAQNTSMATGLEAGTYCVTITDENGCTQGGCVVVDQVTNVQEAAKEVSLRVYPNPVQSGSSFNIDLVRSIKKMTLANPLGQFVQEWEVHGGQQVFHLSAKIPGGYYVLTTIDVSGEIHSIPFLIQ